MEAGDTLFFHPLLIHGSGTTLTSRMHMLPRHFQEMAARGCCCCRMVPKLSSSVARQRCSGAPPAAWQCRPTFPEAVAIGVRKTLRLVRLAPLACGHAPPKPHQARGGEFRQRRL
jgi:hypothetical protein